MIQYTQGIVDITPQPYKHNKQEYDNNIICFDIETTSAWLVDGNVEIFDVEKNSSYYDNAEQIALCYLWTCSINETTYYGRELKEFATFINELYEKIETNFIVWVHNLSFEFQFLLDVFTFDKIFARSPHKIIYADYGRCRFRCSYFLTRLSLDSWSKTTPVKKLVGNLDYNQMRTPLTPLTQNEMNYAENDVLVMYHGLLAYRKKYNNKLHTIPLTQTGEIRKVVKDLYKSDMRYHKHMTNLLPRNAIEYARLIEVFCGGYTHANYSYSGHIIDNVKSRDETSAYPTMMVAYKFPSSRWARVTEWRQYYKNEDYSLILDVTFKGLKSVKQNNYISYSKAYYTSGVVKDNGRVSYAKELRIVTTGIDFEIIERAYTCEEMTVNYAYMAFNEYLDTAFVKLILDNYAKKTTLKGVDGMEDFYLNAKQFINSLYGMCVTAIIQESVVFNNDVWSVDPMTPEMITAELDKKRNKPWSNILAYQHGVFVTAYARRALWSAVLHDDFDEDILYMDTDSVKYINNHDDFFDTYNAMITEKLKTACEFHNIDFELTRPKDKDGNAQPLGVYENDGEYDRFITLGAKRYAWEKDGKLGITVAGASKKHGVKALGGKLENFENGLVFDFDACKRMITTYLSEMPSVRYPDGYTSAYKHGVHFTPSTYTMGVADDYLLLIAVAEELKANFSTMSARELHNITMERVKSETKIL